MGEATAIRTLERLIARLKEDHERWGEDPLTGTATLRGAEVNEILEAINGLLTSNAALSRLAVTFRADTVLDENVWELRMKVSRDLMEFSRSPRDAIYGVAGQMAAELSKRIAPHPTHERE